MTTFQLAALFEEHCYLASGFADAPSSTVTTSITISIKVAYLAATFLLLAILNSIVLNIIKHNCNYIIRFTTYNSLNSLSNEITVLWLILL